MRIAIETINTDLINPRHITAPTAADESLRQSIAAIGLLQPIVVRSNGSEGTWELIAGRRRLAAAVALGWDAIEAHDVSSQPGAEESSGIAMGAAENMVRAPMHPVDQWRAITDLRHATGYSLETAAACLGVHPSMARRMEHLGRMAPELLDALGSGDLPGIDVLRVIAMAPHDVQILALERNRQGERVRWGSVADGCRHKRIRRDLAIFDAEDMVWQIDWLAAEDDPERYTTENVDGFLARQKAALTEQVAKSKGRMILIDDPGADQRETLPKGWRRVYGDIIPKKFRKDDPRRIFARVVSSGYYVGKVLYTLAEPYEEPHKAGAADRSIKPERPAISKKVQARLAELKDQAVRERLQAHASTGAASMLHCLLLAFACNNVRRIPWDIGDALVEETGEPKPVDEASLCRLAAMVIGKIVQFDRPDFFNASGPAAEWIAQAINASMPRTDTDDILKGLNREALTALAQAHGIPIHGTMTEIRKRMVGQLDAWRAASFGAKRPSIGSTDPQDDSEADDQEAENPGNPELEDDDEEAA